ncbi:hypothetical protein [Anaeromicropila populeti]|uniref:Uncharacterized protein n=1 Tax=Anaeromicropila populeti TaxID=37658 RepID=A0A1I6K0F6_9FIRM|nr:hypothetical protein [Anaeromicropila populeti]SFR84696.1 hypothetical protein SAMN05661086_02151 [Anaeromicropila populeti]
MGKVTIGGKVGKVNTKDDKDKTLAKMGLMNKRTNNEKKSTKFTKGYMVTPKNSTLDQRVKRTPAKLSDNGVWTGERGDSTFVSEIQG